MNCLILLVYILFILIIIKKLYCFEKFPYMVSSPSKRNMSYDLRCDPYIEKKNIGPFGMSTINRYYKDKCLDLI